MYFNPRPPRGGRPSGCCARFPACLIFQSTPPARGATNFPEKSCIFIDISIHAPREGGDLLKYWNDSLTICISIHAPREGGDFDDLEEAKGCSRISIHAPREGGDSRERQ